MEDHLEQDTNKRNFGHSVITWEIKNYGLAAWQKLWKVETPVFDVSGPGSRITHWKLKLRTEINGPGIGKGDSNETAKEESDLKKMALNETDLKEIALNETDSKIPPTEASTDEKSLEEVVSTETDCKETKLPEMEILNGDLVLHLERCTSDEGADTVWVDWKVYCFDIHGKKFPVAEENNFFKNEHSHGVYLGILLNPEREFQYNSGIMTLVCQMIVYEENHVMQFDSSLDLDLCSLSEDLKWIFMQGKFCDLTLKFEDRSIAAHKAVLCSRSKSFESMIQENDSGVIEMSDADFDGVLSTLEYVYSSDLKDIVGKPLLSVYDSIIYFNLSELAEHYAPDEQKIRTNIDVMKLTYTWVIEDFTKKENLLSSPILKKDIADAAWQIHLYPRGVDGESSMMAINVEYMDGSISDDICVQCSASDENGVFQNWMTLNKSKKRDSTFEIEEFLDRETLLKLLNGDLLKLGFKVRMCTDKKNLPLDVKSNLHKPYTNDKSLKKFLEDVSSLRQSMKYADLTLIVDGTEIKAHKFVLSARSCLISEMLEETTEDCLTLSNVAPDILKIVLDYMYCGVLDITDGNVLLQVYKAAEELVISRLIDKCSRILRSCITLKNICDILNLADEYNDQLLKTEALKFIFMNPKEVSDLEAWKELTTRKPFLCEEIHGEPQEMSSETKGNASRLSHKEIEISQSNGDKQIITVISDATEVSTVHKVSSITPPIPLLGKNDDDVLNTNEIKSASEELPSATCRTDEAQKTDVNEVEMTLKDAPENHLESVSKDTKNEINEQTQIAEQSPEESNDSEVEASDDISEDVRKL